MENCMVLGYGRSDTIPSDCGKCKENGVCIKSLLRTKQTEQELLQKYLTKAIDLECMSSDNHCCAADANKAAEIIGQALIAAELSELINLIRVAESREPITTDNIPQYGDLSIAMYLIPDLLAQKEHIGYIEFGKMLFYREEKKDEAYRKYAETHCKLAAQLDLAVIKKKKPSGFEITSSVMGRYFSALPIAEKDKILPKLCLRIPIVQEALLSSNYKRAIDKSLSILSESTRIRRNTGIVDLVEFALDE